MTSKKAKTARNKVWKGKLHLTNGELFEKVKTGNKTGKSTIMKKTGIFAVNL